MSVKTSNRGANTNVYVIDADFHGTDLYTTLVENKVLWVYTDVAHGNGRNIDITDYGVVITADVTVLNALRPLQHMVYVAPTTTEKKSRYNWNMMKYFICNRRTSNAQVDTSRGLIAPYIVYDMHEPRITIYATEILQLISTARLNTKWCYAYKYTEGGQYQMIHDSTMSELLSKFEAGGEHYTTILKTLYDRYTIGTSGYVSAINTIIVGIWKALMTEQNLFTTHFKTAMFRQWMTTPSSIVYA